MYILYIYYCSVGQHYWPHDIYGSHNRSIARKLKLERSQNLAYLTCIIIKTRHKHAIIVKITIILMPARQKEAATAALACLLLSSSSFVVVIIIVLVRPLYKTISSSIVFTLLTCSCPFCITFPPTSVVSRCFFSWYPTHSLTLSLSLSLSTWTHLDFML